MMPPATPNRRDHHSARATFAANPGAVTAARRYTRQKLTDWGAGGQTAAASLIVSELATNAVQHAGSSFGLSLTCDHDAVRIVVSDTSEVNPVSRHTKPGATSGYGLNIVSHLAADWGCIVGDHGKEIWVQLAGLPNSDLEAPDQPSAHGIKKSPRSST
jgi:anti-sigma regulatory factor (Ser/Thr protein kinase)